MTTTCSGRGSSSPARDDKVLDVTGDAVQWRPGCGSCRLCSWPTWMKPGGLFFFNCMSNGAGIRISDVSPFCFMYLLTMAHGLDCEEQGITEEGVDNRGQTSCACSMSFVPTTSNQCKPHACCDVIVPLRPSCEMHSLDGTTGEEFRSRARHHSGHTSPLPPLAAITWKCKKRFAELGKGTFRYANSFTALCANEGKLQLLCKQNK